MAAAYCLCSRVLSYTRNPASSPGSRCRYPQVSILSGPTAPALFRTKHEVRPTRSISVRVLFIAGGGRSYDSKQLALLPPLLPLWSICAQAMVVDEKGYFGASFPIPWHHFLCLTPRIDAQPSGPHPLSLPDPRASQFYSIAEPS
jgi:hypothetical protein